MSSVIILWLVTLLSLILYRLLFHPLSRVPGPKLAAISNAWHAYHARNGQMFQLGRTLHKEYGPIVRVGPNEVWFDSREAFKMVYSAGNGFEKSHFYLATALKRPSIRSLCPLRLESADTLDFLSERDVMRYRLQRRVIGPTYQMANIKKYEGAVDAVLDQVVSQLKVLDGAELDLKEWMHLIAVECLGAVVISWSPGYLRDKTDHGSSSHSYLGWRRKSVFGLFPLAAVAEMLSNSLGRAFSTAWGVNYRPPKNFKPFFPGVYQKISRRIRNALRGNAAKDNISRQDLLADLILLHKAKPEFTETYLRRMAMTNFGAGHETMCSALTSAIALIGSHADVQRRAAEEVRQNTPAGVPISYDVASRLTYTQAGVKEAQRLHPAIGMSLSRQVPSGGMHAHGVYVPPDTTVGCNPVALHRNTDIFGADAERFNPDRWLCDTDARHAMERCNLIWGGGARTCPGRNLAELVLHKAVPTLLKHFDVEVVMPPEQDIRYYFMAMLTGVRVRFLHRQDP